MSLSLNKPSPGDTGWAAAINDNWTQLEQLSALPVGYVDGLLVENASASTVHVHPGACRDGENTGDITLSERATADMASVGANGLDVKTLTGTGAASASGTTVTGTGTSFLTAFGNRDLAKKDPAGSTPTISSSGSTVTGSNTKFFEDVKLWDLIGNSTKGYFQVTAVSSDTSLTINTTPGSAFSGDTVDVIENPTLEVQQGGGQPDQRRVLTISSDTNLTVTSAFTYTHTTGALKAGVEISHAWYAVWVVAGSSGTAAILSTQRTALLDPPAGYDQFARRLGWQYNFAGSDFIYTRQEGRGRTRKTHFEAKATLLSAGTATSWTALGNIVNFYAPPVAHTLHIWVMSYRADGAGVSNSGDCYVTTRSTTASLGDQGSVASITDTGSANTSSMIYEQPCSGAQQFEYQCVNRSSADQFAYISILGWTEDL